MVQTIPDVHPLSWSYLSPRMSVTATSQIQGISHTLIPVPCIKRRWDTTFPSASLAEHPIHGWRQIWTPYHRLSWPLQDVTKDMVQNRGRDGGFKPARFILHLLLQKEFFSSHFFWNKWQLSINTQIPARHVLFVFSFLFFSGEPKAKAHTDKKV